MKRQKEDLYSKSVNIIYRISVHVAVISWNAKPPRLKFKDRMKY